MYKPVIPKKAKYPAIVIVQSNEDLTHQSPLYSQLIEDMNKIGFTVFSYDRRVSNAAQTNFIELNDLALDASAVIDLLKNRIDVDTSKIGVFGFGQGGWVAAMLSSMRNDLAFNVFVSTSTMKPTDQASYALFNNLQDKKFTRLEIDSAIRLRTIIEDYYTGKLTFEQASPLVQRDSASLWYKGSNFPQLIQPKENSSWYKQMNFDPLPYFLSIKKPALVIYGDQDHEVSADKGVYDWRKSGVLNMELKRIDFAGHSMIESEDQNGITISAMYRNLIESWVKRQGR